MNNRILTENLTVFVRALLIASIHLQIYSQCHTRVIFIYIDNITDTNIFFSNFKYLYSFDEKFIKHLLLYEINCNSIR